MAAQSEDEPRSGGTTNGDESGGTTNGDESEVPVDDTDERPDESTAERPDESTAEQPDEGTADDGTDARPQQTADAHSELFAVSSTGEAIELEVVQTEIFTVDASGDVVDVTETVDVVERGAAAEPAWHMPSETAPQDRIWMAFPPSGSYLGEAESLQVARTAWGTVAHSILPFEPVTMVVDPHDLGEARRALASDIDIVVAPLDDAWMRDIGPTFVLGDDGRLGAVTWRFNGWGAQEWAHWDNDSAIGAFVAVRSGARRVLSDLVNEGGGIHVDGLGTVLLTESVQLDPHRNPQKTKAEVEAELARTLGTTNPIWLRRGLYRDAKRFGTRGHVDILATVPSPARLLVHVQTDAAHPDHEITREIVDTLSASHTPDGEEWDIVELPAPQVLRDETDFVDYSYVNHLVVNGAVIACTFDDPNDAMARDILAEAYTGREIVGVDARAVFALGGGIHCITQHQPTSGAR
jgi:agmatine deiminase